LPLKLCGGGQPTSTPRARDGGKRKLERACSTRFPPASDGVRPILSQSGRQRLLWTRDHTPKLSTGVTPSEGGTKGPPGRHEACPWERREQGGPWRRFLREPATRKGIQPGDPQAVQGPCSACQGVRLPVAATTASCPEATWRSWRAVVVGQPRGKQAEKVGGRVVARKLPTRRA